MVPRGASKDGLGEGAIVGGGGGSRKKHSGDRCIREVEKEKGLTKQRLLKHQRDEGRKGETHQSNISRNPQAAKQQEPNNDSPSAQHYNP